MQERTCDVEGCNREHRARGWCSAHYRRWQKAGDPGTADLLVKVIRQAAICSVDGCDRERTQRDWCAGHYARWWRRGDLGSADIADRSMPRVCVVDGCGKPHESNGYCCAHAHRLRRYGHPTHAPPRPKVGDPQRWIKSDVGYMGAHNRVRRLRGKANTHTCQMCAATAQDWAYDHQDPNEKHETVNGYVIPYSADPAHYMPLCKSCHVTFDR